jgi:folate-binding protein YgfZ
VVTAPTQDQLIAQSANWDVLGGINFRKGCYTGQEIIARTQHLGRIKRRLFHLALPPGAWSIGQTVKLADGRGGRLTEVVAGAQGVEALAVLTLEPGGEAEGDSAPVAAREIPLPYRLES